MDIEIRSFASVDPEIMSGTPCFIGTRVPVQILIDWMANGETLDFFHENYPRVSRDQTEKCLRFSAQSIPKLILQEYEVAA